jgi:hypothetical protein
MPVIHNGSGDFRCWSTDVAWLSISPMQDEARMAANKAISKDARGRSEVRPVKLDWAKDRRSYLLP